MKVAAFGKAVLGMVTALEDVIGEHIMEGVASVPMGTVETAGEAFPQYLPKKDTRIRYRLTYIVTLDRFVKK